MTTERDRAVLERLIERVKAMPPNGVVSRWEDVSRSAVIDELLAALAAAPREPEAREARVDMFATQLQETGRATVHPGDEAAALAALRAIGVESFVVTAREPEAASPDLALDVERLAQAFETVVSQTSGVWVDYSGASNAGDIPKSRMVFLRELAAEYARLGPSDPPPTGYLPGMSVGTGANDLSGPSDPPPHEHDWRDHGSRGESGKPDIRCAAPGHSGPSDPPESLDAAWREAEAALPEGWGIGVEPSGRGYEVGAGRNQWHEWDGIAYPTLAAALRALAARLRESSREAAR